MTSARYFLTRVVTVVTATAGCGYIYLRASDDIYAGPFGKLIQSVDAERAHRIGVLAARYGIASIIAHNDKKEHGEDEDNDDMLKIKLWGKEFNNPIGLAAGFDKDGEAVSGMLDIGFGFVEIGSVTPLPQRGNYKPRVFRLKEDRGIINRYGFNSKGIDIVKENLKHVYKYDDDDDDDGGGGGGGHKMKKGVGIIGVNLGKNKNTIKNVENDYVLGIERLGSFADYIVINVSSPNTPGLRKLQEKEKLRKLIISVFIARDKLLKRPPIVLKISPDLSEQDKHDIADLSMELGIDGLIVSNTTIERNGLQSKYANESGGLSGRPLKKLSTDVLRDMYRLTHGSIPLIGVGGVENGVDAYEKLKAGASLVQLYTALIYEGPAVVPRIKKSLKALLLQDGYTSVEQVIGISHKKDAFR